MASLLAPPDSATTYPASVREAYVAALTATQRHVPGVEAYKVWGCLPGARHRASNHFSSLRLLSTVFSMKWTPLAPS